MKKTISFLLALILVCSCFAFRSPEANALFGAVWVKEYYKDKFGDKTDQFYITNKSQFKGTYNSDSVSNGKMGANLIFEQDGESILAYVVLFLNGKDQLKNGTSSGNSYDISVKRVDGSQFSTYGYMAPGEDRIEIHVVEELASSLCDSGDEIGIYIEDQSNAINYYVFKAKCGNFKDLYQQEILLPYQEEQYQLANQLVNDERYDEAIVIFDSISEYNDSYARSAEAAEKKNEKEYAKAEEFFRQGKYNEARAIFESLGNYKDSYARSAEAAEKKNEIEYAKAEEFFRQGKYNEARAIFESLGNYKDSVSRIDECEQKQYELSLQPMELPEIDISEWQYVLVNGDHPLDPIDYEPAELAYLNMTGDDTEILMTFDPNRQMVDARIAQPLVDMVQACKAAGLPVFLSSGYRSYATQQANFERVCYNKGITDGKNAEGNYITMPAGCSEHQTGLGIDILDYYHEIKSDELAQVPTVQWLVEHCADYGFVLRFPPDKRDVTHVMGEAWHFRYVGVEAAKYMTENNLVLEEFLELY